MAAENAVPMKRTLLLVFIMFLGFIGHSTVKGPITIEFVGYDIEKNIVYLARTDWAECDCETDLYIYYINQDSIEIIKYWSGRNDFRLRRQGVLLAKGLENLTNIEPTSSNKIDYLFKWLPKIDYYSPVMMKDTMNCPFLIQISEDKYEFIQCYSQNERPTIQEYLINDSIGFLHIKYKGDCFEGNTHDELILIKKAEKKLESKLLIGSKLIKQ
ncbi:MAG: hypothetical protein AB7E36_09635 [Salinivirgaceae bacterium]